MRLVDCDSRELKQEWPAPAGCKITVGSANLSQVVVALTGGELVHLELNVTQKELVGGPEEANIGLWWG